MPRTPSEICDQEGHMDGQEKNGILICPRCGAEL